MFAFTLLALAGAAFAAPARRTDYGGGCDLSAVTLNPPAGYDFPAPYGAPKYVTVGGGTQNYTCGTDGKYASVGAVAQLFDLSCIVFTDTFLEVQDLLIEVILEAPLSSRTYDEQTLPFLADHYFVQNPVTGVGISPKFDFTATVGDFVVGKSEVSTPAPTGPQDVNWLKLSNIEGGLSQLVFRTDTRRGQPPASCTYGSDTDLQVPYAAKYWFF